MECKGFGGCLEEGNGEEINYPLEARYPISLGNKM